MTLSHIFTRQISSISDKKLSEKLKKELQNSVKNFTPEKREFYKKILVSLYTKWLPLIEESKEEAKNIINNNK